MAVTGGNANAGIVHPNFQMLIRFLKQFDHDISTGRREFDGIGNEIGQHLLDLFRIKIHHLMIPSW